MNLDDLIEASKNWQPTDEQIRAFEKRMLDAEARFARESKAKEVSEDFLNRQYTI
jgi:hypothetical protein